MTQKQETFISLQEFLTKHQTNPEQLKKSDYRSFFGKVQGSCEWIKRDQINQEQLTIAQEVDSLLTNWAENHDNKRSISQESCQRTSKEYHELLNKYENKKPNQDNKPTSLFDKIDDKLTQVEEGFKWMDWYKKNKLIIKGSIIIVVLLFTWLIIRTLIHDFLY